MKNMFSKLGTKTVAGAVLVGATLMVGLGVVNNFSGSNQKAANEMALSHFGDSAYNNFGGSSASRADLERQLSATQDGYSARFLKGKSDGTNAGDAYSSDGAYEEGVRADEGFVYAQDGSYGPNGAYGPNGVYGGEYGPNGAYANGDAYNPFGSTYEQGEGAIGEDFASNAAAYGAKQFQEAQEAAAAAAAEGKNAKVAKNKNNGAKGKDGKVRPATQINKLASSNGGSAFGSGGGTGGVAGGAGSFGGASAMGGGDNNTRALPQNDKQAEGNAFKFGRAGAIGGFNVGVNGSEYKGGNNKGRGAAADLWLANAYSSKARASNTNEGAKGLAPAAFDGSNPDGLSSPLIESGSTVGVADSLFDTSGLGDSIGEGLSGVRSGLDDLSAQQDALIELQDDIVGKYWLTLILTIIMATLVYSFVQAFYTTWNPLLLLGALLLTAGALAFIYGMVHGYGHGFGDTPGDNSILGMIEQMKDEERFGMVNDNIDFEARANDAELFGYSMAGLIGLMWVPGATASVVGSVAATVAVCIGIFSRWGYKED